MNDGPLSRVRPGSSTLDTASKSRQMATLRSSCWSDKVLSRKRSSLPYNWLNECLAPVNRKWLGWTSVACRLRNPSNLMHVTCVLTRANVIGFAYVFILVHFIWSYGFEFFFELIHDSRHYRRRQFVRTIIATPLGFFLFQRAPR